MTEQQADYDENKTTAAATALVAYLRRTVAVQKRWIAALVVTIIAVVCIVGYLFYRNDTEAHALQAAQQSEQRYVQLQLQHECQALELLTATPVPQPTDPATNPSRETTYKFYMALVYWEKADGCPAITVHNVNP
jgi:hypothetical protein